MMRETEIDSEVKAIATWWLSGKKRSNKTFFPPFLFFNPLRCSHLATCYFPLLSRNSG